MDSEESSKKSFIDSIANIKTLWNYNWCVGCDN